ncbi:MAG: hypothetical protein IRY94_13465 [Rhodospirillaceae bacterium]|nr:hypothetical protein [Rhodospirillaceae bacterium]
MPARLFRHLDPPWRWDATMSGLGLALAGWSLFWAQALGLLHLLPLEPCAFGFFAGLALGALGQRRTRRRDQAGARAAPPSSHRTAVEASS